MGNSSNLKLVTITHPHPCVNYFTLLSHNECGFLEGAKLTALKSTEQVLQRHQQSQFSFCTSIFLSHCGLTIRQPQLCPESRYNLPSLRIFCSFPTQKCPSYVDFFFLGISWMKEANCGIAVWTGWAVRLASSRSWDSPPNCHGEMLLWAFCIPTTCTQPLCRQT